MEKIRVLFLAADPVSADPTRRLDDQPPRLRIDEEIREITKKIRAAEYRDSLDLVARWAVCADDLLQALNEVRPHIVHFSGHGSSAGELILVGKGGLPHRVSSKALLSLFRTMKDNIRLVLLNACYTSAQAEGIVEVIDCVIGMDKRIGDQAASTFSASFYRALGFGRSVYDAVEQGRVALQLDGISEDLTPQLLAREGVDPVQVFPVVPMQKDHGNLAMIQEELQRNLQRLAGQIAHTRINVPGANPDLRRPGETRNQFEDRDREWFAREVAHVFSTCQRFTLEEIVYTVQRADLTQLNASKRMLMDGAYGAVSEARDCVLSYRDRMQRLSGGKYYDGEHRRALAVVYSRQAVNALGAHWFKILGNWLMLEPGTMALRMVGEMLPEVLGNPVRPPPLTSGEEGWSYALQEHARLLAKQVSLDVEEAALAAKPLPNSARTTHTASTFTDAMARASLAYCEGKTENAIDFLQQALCFEGVSDDHRHFAETSLVFLRSPDAFDGASGAYLLELVETGVAAQAGFKRGDVILQYNGFPVAEPLVLSRLISQARNTPFVPVQAVRGSERSTWYVKGGASLEVTATALVYAESFAV